MSGDGERKPAPGLAGRTRGLKISSIAIVILVAFACSFLIWKVSERLFGDKEQPANAGLSDSARLALGGEWSSGQQSGGGRKESRSSADDRLMHLEPVYLSEPWPVTQPIDDDLFPNLSGASVKFGKTGGNTVSGTVSFDGEPPAERVIPMDPESLRHRVGLPSPTTRFYVVSESGRVGDVVVYLEGRLPSIRSTNDFGPLLIDHVGSMKTP